MKTCYIKFVLLAALFQMAGATAPLRGFLWWGEKEQAMPPEQQNERAAPLMEKARQAAARDRPGRACSLFNEVYEKYPESVHAPEALFQAGELLRARGKRKKAFEAWQKLITRYPDFPRFNEVIDRQFGIAQTMKELGRKQRFPIFSDKSLRAVEFYEQVSRNAPYSKLSPRCLLSMARIYLEKEKIPEAIDSLDRLINYYPDSPQAPEAYLMLADTFKEMVDGPLYDQGATREAINYYQDYLILYPGDPNVRRGEEGLAEMKDLLARSKLVLGKYYYKYRGDYTAARIFFNETITVSPEAPAADTAREYLAKLEVLEEAFKKKLAEKKARWIKKLLQSQEDEPPKETETNRPPDKERGY